MFRNFKISLDYSAATIAFYSKTVTSPIKPVLDFSTTAFEINLSLNADSGLYTGEIAVGTPMQTGSNIAFST